MLPDEYLAQNIAAQTDVQIIAWKGHCEVHERFTPQELLAYKARELGVPYAAINVVANFAAGRGDSRKGINFDAIQGELHESMEHVRCIIETMVDHGDPARS